MDWNIIKMPMGILTMEMKLTMKTIFLQDPINKNPLKIKWEMMTMDCKNKIKNRVKEFITQKIQM